MTLSKDQLQPLDHEPAERSPESSAQDWRRWWLERLPQKRWRLWSGVGLTVLVVFTASSILTRRRSIEAYVTTDVVTITSPIQGLVSAQPVTAGQQFKANEMVVEVRAGRKEMAQIQATELLLREADGEAGAISQALQHAQRVNRARLKEEVVAAQRTLLDLQAQFSRYRSQAERYQQLVTVGAMDSDSLAGARAMAASYRERVENQRDLLNSLRHELRSAHVEQQHDQASTTSSRRMEAMEIEMGRLSSRLQELQAKRGELKRELAALRQESKFIYRPQFPGQVLSTRFSIGDEVNPSSVLLTAVNCNNFRVEALFVTSKLRDLQIGKQVQVHWPLNKTSSVGQIVSIRGEQGLTGLESTGAARFRPANVDRSRLLIRLPSGTQAAKTCRLGEKVRVDL